MSRSPILEYSDYNAIPTYVPPTITPGTTTTIITEASVIICTEDSIDLETDAPSSSQTT